MDREDIQEINILKYKVMNLTEVKFTLVGYVAAMKEGDIDEVSNLQFNKRQIDTISDTISEYNYKINSIQTKAGIGDIIKDDNRST